ncbi:MAG: hypothetical protein ACP5GX_05915 [Anaerolineae bacterium]
MQHCSIPFTPPHVSVNRVRIVDLPGLPVDEEVRGRLAYNLLSVEAIAHYAEAHAVALDLSPITTLEERREVPKRVDGALRSSDPEAQAAARAIARRLGRNLAYVVLTLHRGDSVNRAARDEWTALDWERWSAVRQVWLAGGVMSGDLGALIVEEARLLLDALGDGEAPEVAISPCRGDMALLGAARYLSEGDGARLSFDFGHTMVKRARLTLEDGVLSSLEHLPAFPTRFSVFNRPDMALGYTGEEVRDFIADSVARTMSESGIQPPDLVLSVAAYVRGGRLLGNGIYARVSTLAEDVRPLLEEAVEDRTGHRLRVRVIHDGTAAATMHAGEVESAVILVGTALGVGFPSSTVDGLRPVSPAFG